MRPRAYSYTGLSGALCRGLFQRPWLPLTLWKALFSRAIAFGVRSAPTLFLMAFCIGFVIALVLQDQLAKLSMAERVPRLIWIVLNYQVSPMLTAVVFIGRSVSGASAELANMKIAEEIKALETMGIDVSRYLLLPMLGAFVVMLPIMEIYAVGVGLLGAYAVGAQVMGMSVDQFVARAIEGTQFNNVLWGLGKALVFSILIAMIAFQKGLNASGGSDAVGRVATSAVVVALIAVTIVNAVITALQIMAF